MIRIPRKRRTLRFGDGREVIATSLDIRIATQTTTGFIATGYNVASHLIDPFWFVFSLNVSTCVEPGHTRLP